MSFKLYPRMLTCGLFFCLISCTTYDLSRPVIQQGNILTASLVERLKIGMSKQEVETLLGTSLVSSFWTNDRWDYIYMRRKRGNAFQKRHLSLYFSAGRLIKITQND